MGSWIRRTKTGPFTITRNLSTGKTTTSTSTGSKGFRITRSTSSDGRTRTTTTRRMGDMVQRSSKITGGRRSSKSIGDPSANALLIGFCLVCVVLYYTWIYILIGLGLFVLYHIVKAFMSK